MIPHRIHPIRWVTRELCEELLLVFWDSDLTLQCLAFWRLSSKVFPWFTGEKVAVTRFHGSLPTVSTLPLHQPGRRSKQSETDDSLDNQREIKQGTDFPRDHFAGPQTSRRSNNFLKET